MRKRSVIVIIFLWAVTVFALFPCGIAFAQAPDTLWTKTYGGIYDDIAYSVKQTSDGGYIVAGYSSSFGAGGYDVYLVKTNSGGDTLWIRTYGGINDDRGYSVQQTADGGYIVAGFTKSFGAGGSDVYLIKIDANGDLLWAKTYGGGDHDVGYAVQQTTDGYIIAGRTNSFGAGSFDLYLIRTDTNGDTLWTKTYGGISTDGGYSVQETADGGYIAVGYTFSYGSGLGDVYLIKTDENGAIQWTKTYGGSRTEEGYSIEKTSDGGYIITGYTGSFGAGGNDVYLIKIDSGGDTLWTRSYGGTEGDDGRSVQQTADDGYIITGRTSSFGQGSEDVYLIRTDEDGNTIWTETFGGTADDGGRFVQETSDGGYIITGYTESFGAGYRDLYLIKIKPEPDIEEHQNQNTNTQALFIEIFPNPFRDRVNIRCRMEDGRWNSEVRIYDATGRLVKEFIPPTAYSSVPTVISWDGRDESGRKVRSGVYFLRLEAGGYRKTKKLLLVR